MVVSKLSHTKFEIMRKNNKAKKNKKRGLKYQAHPRAIYLAPPTYEQQPTRSWKVRCQVSAACLGNVLSGTQLCGILGVTAITTTSGVFIGNQFRLKRTCIWGPVTTAGTPVSVELKYADDPAGVLYPASAVKAVGDTSVSFDRPAYACLTPNKESYANLWTNCLSTAAVLVISCPAGAIIDFDFQFLIDDLGALNGARALVGATAGTYYHLIATLSGSQTVTAVSPLNSI